MTCECQVWSKLTGKIVSEKHGSKIDSFYELVNKG